MVTAARPAQPPPALGPSGVAGEPSVRAVFRMIEAGAWDELRPSLHPYLHWTDGNGTRLRGRSNVLAALREGRLEVPGPPAAFELRDGQVYRWRQAELTR